MNLPTIEEYTDAMQAPAASILDPLLARGRVQANAWGAPFARSGTFALTFKVAAGGAQYAFRCFQIDRPSMRERYAAISAFLTRNPLPYFVDFDFQQQGIRVAGNVYPAIRMTWAEGAALGNYVEEHLDDPGRLRALQQQLHGMALALDGAGIAHGDIQSNNILVGAAGDIRLVDYDGMFVPDLASLGSIETGHRNFQHPGRAAAAPFDGTLDRFSVALIHTALACLIESPGVWKDLQADNDTLLLRASDLADPLASEAFDRLESLPVSGVFARRLRSIAAAPYSATPAFSDFLTGRNLPELPSGASSRVRAPKTSAEPPWYASVTGDAELSAASTPPGSKALETYEPGHLVVAPDALVGRPELVGQLVEVVGEVEKVVPASESSWRVFLRQSSLGARTRVIIRREPDWPEPKVGEWLAVTSVLGDEFDSVNRAPCLRPTLPDAIETLTAPAARWRLAGPPSGKSQGPDGGGNESRLTALTGTGTAPPSPPLAGASVQSSQSGNTMQSNTSVAKFWLLIGLIVVGLVLFFSFLANQSPSGSSYVPPSNDPYSQTQPSEFEVTAQSEAGALAGRCFTSLEPLSENDCNSSLANYRASSQPVAWATECSEIAPEVPFLAGDGNFACMRLINTAAASERDFESCVATNFEGEEPVCSQGLSWSYSACWDTPNLVLEQQLGNQWVLISARITKSEAESADVCATPDFPHHATFTLTEQPKEDQIEYRIAPTDSAVEDPFLEYLTVRMSRVPT